jgi:hypothetical protein
MTTFGATAAQTIGEAEARQLGQLFDRLAALGRAARKGAADAECHVGNDMHGRAVEAAQPSPATLGQGASAGSDR